MQYAIVIKQLPVDFSIHGLRRSFCRFMQREQPC